MKYELPNDDEIRYHGLMRVWSNQTGMMSYTVYDHPAFLEILAMKDKIPLIKLALWDMENYSHNCLAILRKIVPNQPEVSEEMRGKISQLKELWWKWGQENGYFD